MYGTIMHGRLAAGSSREAFRDAVADSEYDPVTGFVSSHMLTPDGGGDDVRKENGQHKPDEHSGMEDSEKRKKKVFEHLAPRGTLVSQEPFHEASEHWIHKGPDEDERHPKR